MEYYPPTPAHLSKEEYRRYYRILNDFFDSALLKTGFNGGVLVAKDGAIVFEKYQGKKDLRGSDTMSANTPLHLASTSKTFTAVATLRLIQENKLSLNDSLSKFFPGFPYPGITVKMLLSHRSGLPNYVYFMDHSTWDKKKKATNEDMLNMLYSERPNPAFTPNTHFSYCNTNFVLLAMIIEKVTGRSFPEYMRTNFFEPLRMKDTYVFTAKDTLTATPSFTHSGGYWDYDFLDGTYGDKNIYSTPRDLLKWDQALYTEQILTRAWLDSAFTPNSNERASVHNYGLGWRMQLLPNGKKIVYHFGKWHGFNAAFARLTDEKATIIILGNKFNRCIYNSALACYDIFGEYLQTQDGDEENDSTEKKAASNLPRTNKKARR
jgi:CubicO group peptidase (beta-lactamase class C family)